MEGSKGLAVYIAAKFEMRAVLRALVPQIEALGHKVTAKWVTRDELHLPPHMIALDDLASIEAADLLILDTSFPNGSGREVEFGYALGKGKRVWIVGPSVNVFHSHQDVVHFSDWRQVFRQLEEERG